MTTVYHNIIRSFPKGYSLAFAYGSAVLPQFGHKAGSTIMLDFIFAVSDPLSWHRDNLRLHPRHYSVLGALGAAAVAGVQEGGAHLYYNTLVPTHAGLIKYGVISRRALIADLLDWESLYVSGRLHKPVRMLYTDPADQELQRALQVNLYAAVHTALLLLPDTFTEEQLHCTLAGLSYTGDFRMHVGEDRSKVRNIARGQVTELRRLYAPVLAAMHEYVVLDGVTGQAAQDTSQHARHHHLSLLPMRLQMALIRECNRDGRSRDLEEVLRAAASDPDAGDMIVTGLRSIVLWPSLTQALKGILTAGLYKSARYAAAKVGKRIAGWRR